MRDYIGTILGASKRDTRSLDYSAHESKPGYLGCGLEEKYRMINGVGFAGRQSNQRVYLDPGSWESNGPKNKKTETVNPKLRG